LSVILSFFNCLRSPRVYSTSTSQSTKTSRRGSLWTCVTIAHRLPLPSGMLYKLLITL
jgi:hypothetical protein